MINKNRIVPITRTDLLTLIGTIFGLAGTSYTSLQALDVEGNFKKTGSGDVGNILCAQPVKSFEFASGVTAGVAFFVAACDYEGFKVAGTAVTTAGATVKADCATVYKATLSSGDVTIAAVSPIAS